jgi:flavin-binding protein dodecin
MSTYKVIEIIGNSYTSWADAGKNALETAATSLEDLRVAEVSGMDMKIEENGKVQFRTRLKVSFKFRSLEKFAESLGAKPYAQEEG